MKHTILSIILLLFWLQPDYAIAQFEEEKLDLPGDNLNLYATLKLFQESETLEGFERSLNDESSQINNLDLNGDNKIDYIEVADNIEDDIHYITMKVAVNQNQAQNVGVFIVKKDRNGEIEIQLVGDEDLYGPDYIIEPNSEAPLGNSGSTPNPGYTPGNQQNVVVQNNVNYQVSAWPVIRFIFVPTYIVWRSPWRWNYYPNYWRPWRPQYWHYYYGYHYNMYGYYNGYYRRSRQYRDPGWRQHYYSSPIRSRSVIVVDRTRRGDYNRTYSRPGSAKAGYNTFRKKNPTVATGNNRLPSFDKTGRPVISRPTTGRPDATKPATGRPGRETATPQRPVTRPGVSEPGNGNTTPSRPVTRPIPTPENGNTTPSRPIKRPGNDNTVPSRPITRPESGVTNPSRPVTRPDNDNTTPSRPVTRPESGNSNPSRPATRPGNPTPTLRPSAQPASRPATNRLPENKPAVSRPAPNRPAPEKPAGRERSPR